MVIATKHKKEAVIAPLLEKNIGVKCFVPKNFDTDIFGTFSGEIDRNDDAIATVRKKCLLAMKETDCDLGIASEGSFGQHPTLFFANADEEFLIFIDKKNNLEIIARELSLETNFNSKTINNDNDLMEFIKKVKFPEHAVILKNIEKKPLTIIKGIQNLKFLQQNYRKISSSNNEVIIETDMRAMFNPTRMKIIEIATQKLINKIKSVCPQCKTPGFDISKIVSGLECSYCNLPTNSTKSLLYECKKCKYKLEKLHPNNKKSEDPMYCNFCNP